MADETDNGRMDYVAMVTRGALGAIPIVGSLLAELAGAIIPQQRMDRIGDLAKKLEERLTGLDRDMLRAKLGDENFTDLFEETIRDAVRAVSDERRAYLAELFANGISGEKISYLESKQLLRLLSEINDVEVIWLRYFLDRRISGDDEFREKHDDILRPVGARIGSDQNTLDKQALRDSYVDHLTSLGLLEVRYKVDSKTKTPFFDRITGRQQGGYHEVSPLGRLLLRQIGFPDD